MEGRNGGGMEEWRDRDGNLKIICIRTAKHEQRKEKMCDRMLLHKFLS